MLLRRLLGDVLRRHRLQQSRTLRDVSGAAGVSLGYLSEVERGRKEASSELLAAICTALDITLSEVLREVSDDLAREERRLRLAPVGFSSSAAPRLAPGVLTAPVLARPVAGVAPRIPVRADRPQQRPVAPVGSLTTRSAWPVVAA